MAFQVEDFRDLLRLLEEHPEWRAELRRQVLTDELLDLPAIVRELAEQTAATARAQQETSRRLDQLSTQTAALVEQVSKLGGRVGYVEGKLLEMHYERHYAGVFGRLARRLRLVDWSSLADRLDDAEEHGLVTQDERENVMQSDVVMRGKRRTDGAESYFVVEISHGVGRDDVRRAVERASILRKLGDHAEAVVAGRWINHEAEAMAKDEQVACVIEGRVAES